MQRVEKIKMRLEQALAPVSLAITDDSHRHRGHAGAAAGGGHFSIVIVSARFAGLNPVQRHRLVYQALADMMPAEIHALGIQASTPDET